MLDNETKRRIDTARDILVGKVPDPKSQVEQITIALIYKFMDDMDAEAEELGGERTFFAGDYEKYSWAKLLAPGMGGFEVSLLYTEAIAKMTENPGIPALFRDIFKNAYLPYRDPETLKAFLKVINDFTYDHSERLGDAFEYLLSVLGSQGDAGQFRTPRHIIDFMVAIIDPQKQESILDPACGTAGFLISAYKHIMAANARNGRPGAALTPDERTRLLNNIQGYDISPDMVRLSLVNLYLHGFNDPHIYEYDTLTSEDRWHEYFDIIMANPPFMSPKGGIRPHKRFSVQSNRSEVLFVDYIAEHLSPNGRAAVIVPEGIIFQSQNAYKQLRKLLVDEYLVGVISLPAGVFNPYSGVKTSILWLDKALAKKTDQIAFVKIEQDGFDLGAQRREIKQNDLPLALAEIARYKAGINNGADFDTGEYQFTVLVGKDEIAANGDYNLSGERYKRTQVISSVFPIVKLAEVADVIAGQSPDSKFYNQNGEGLPFYQGKTEFQQIYLGKPKYWTTQVTREAYPGDILMSVRAPVGPVNIATERICIGRGLAAIRARSNILPMYLFYILRSQEENIVGDSGAVFANISKQQISQLELPLPPLAVQEEIVSEIESYQKIIDGARQVVENYRPRLPLNPDWPLVELGSVCDFIRGPFGGSLRKEIFVDNGFAVYEQSHAIKNQFEEVRYFIDEDKFKEMKRFEVSPGDLIMSCSGTMGKVAIVPESIRPGIINQALLKLTPRNGVSKEFLKLWMDSDNFQESLENVTFGAAIKNVASVKILKQLQIPLPDLITQERIVDEIEQEQSLINANYQLIKRFEQKIKDGIAQVWGGKPAMEEGRNIQDF